MEKRRALVGVHYSAKTPIIFDADRFYEFFPLNIYEPFIEQKIFK